LLSQQLFDRGEYEEFDSRPLCFYRPSQVKLTQTLIHFKEGSLSILDIIIPAMGIGVRSLVNRETLLVLRRELGSDALPVTAIDSVYWSDALPATTIESVYWSDALPATTNDSLLVGLFLVLVVGITSWMRPIRTI